jgi:hypothetical protein
VYDEYSDGIDDLDYEQLETDCNDTAFQASEATGDNDIMVGLNPNGRFDYELWVDGGRFGGKAVYFTNFEELREAIKEKYPDADWENLGW